MWELQHPEQIEPERVRKPGGGRKPTIAWDPELGADLERLVSPSTRGDPQSPLRWTSKSTRKLAAELNQMRPGRSVSDFLVRSLLHQMGYSLQANRKTHQGTEQPDRDAQFEHINATVRDYQRRSQPVISVDTKKKELLGDFKNPGGEWRPKGQPEMVRLHDFVLPELGKVSPYGVYDPTRNEAWVNVGTGHDTATFAVASIRGWWQSMGPTGVSGCHRATDHRRRRRQQQRQEPTLEGRAATAGRSNQAEHRRLPLPAWHQQVEQG